MLVTAFSPSTMFSTFPKTNFTFLATYIFLSANAVDLDHYKFCGLAQG